MKLRLIPAARERAVPGSPLPRAVELHASSGETLARAIWLSGQVQALPLCAGLGRCGRCRVRFVRDAPAPLPAEEAVFSADALALGWRLACRRQVPDAAAGGMLTLELPAEDLAEDAGSAALSGASGPQAAERELVLAVDLGTTSVHWRAPALDAPRGDLFGKDAAQGHFLNPQAGAGADVMSRLAVAREPQGRKLLAGLARERLGRILTALGADGGRVSRICLAANTAMTDIFLDRDVAGLCAAPYRISHSGHEIVHLPGLPPLYIPPLPGPFVGGDVSAGLAALLARETPRPFVLADLGTNGELALVTEKDELVLASVPLGPALEGIGPECGQLAGPEVITEFSLTPLGLAAHLPGPAHEPGPACACPACRAATAGVRRQSGEAAVPGVRGISATGYLSLLAVLLQLGLLDSSGRFPASSSPPPRMPLARRLAEGFARGPAGTRLHLPCGLWLAAGDVEVLLKVKAAFALALEKLLAAGKVRPAELAALCLAGALGEHVRPQHLETLGFVPAGLGPRIRAVGNAALDGAALLALQPERGDALADLCGRARLLALVEDPDFQQEYLRGMRFGA
ncbi:ASKHA domain-containing protein [Desulfovibrio sp. ZJ369]|uniref:ASKHA domain-containing protein n=1 Tax=Desulfovibrio sp. ZJ369 TaxID=2709793 RepID=UPI0013EAA1CF|nr:ASKHA domain-containing protein [Desulfovibrio sp. ZJ369]